MTKQLFVFIWGVLHSCMLGGLLFLFYQYLLGTGLSYAFNGPSTIDWPSNILFLAFISVILVLFQVLSGQLLIHLDLLDRQDKHLWSVLLGLFWAVLFGLLIGSVLYSFSQTPLPDWRLPNTLFVAIVCLIWLVEAALRYWIVSKRLHIQAHIGLIWWLCCCLLLLALASQLQDLIVLGAISAIGFGVFQAGLLWNVLQEQKSVSFWERVI
jgi:hypothetical protein